MDIDEQRTVPFTKICSDNPTKQIRFYLTDVSSRSSLEKTFEEVIATFHSIDCIVALAGVFDELNYERTVKINLVIKRSLIIEEKKSEYFPNSWG